MKPFLRWALVLGVSAATAGCISMSVSSHLQPGVNFAPYRTWEWGPADNLPTGDPRLDNNTIFKDHLEGAVEKALATRGFARAETGTTPDLFVHYHASINQRIQVDEPEGNCTVECKPGVVEYDQGTLVIDVMDARTDSLLWRGWAQDSVQGVIDNQPLMERKIDEAITRMMARFPAEI